MFYIIVHDFDSLFSLRRNWKSGWWNGSICCQSERHPLTKSDTAVPMECHQSLNPMLPPLLKSVATVIHSSVNRTAAVTPRMAQRQKLSFKPLSYEPLCNWMLMEWNQLQMSASEPKSSFLSSSLAYDGMPHWLNCPLGCSIHVLWALCIILRIPGW